MTTEPPCRLAFFSHPRTASNLILKILNISSQHDVLEHPDLPDYGHSFSPAIKLKVDGQRVRKPSEWTEEERTATNDHYGKGLATVIEYAALAETQGRIAFFREHSISISDPVAQYCFYSGTSVDSEEAWSNSSAHTTRNRTLLPDDFLRQWYPIFVIRHPASAFSSYYRVLKASDSGPEKILQQATMVNTYHWTRTLYDLYKHTFGITGIILDADDVVANPQLLINASKRVGLDPQKLKFTWNATSSKAEITAKTTHDPQHLEFMETLDRSTGVIRGDLRGKLDVGVMGGKWREEFGEEEGRRLEGWVAAAMDDYRYLEQEKFRA
ncbi:hypothetical protein BKA58DRAFT_450015 [Alternaria rosae]|uniref:uncharacterized protein n=1 Tax=Alternaria rosae TaxID=1187941 RepID=UPI001E8CCB7B|nr:uncharacterized protein BKA58DRAFT_450015 [Alternaria rosae]KAH6857447.1 hypothetical protein BKA58DRAFT_450015 [Alternaria rosae]